MASGRTYNCIVPNCMNIFIYTVGVKCSRPMFFRSGNVERRKRWLDSISLAFNKKVEAFGVFLVCAAHFDENAFTSSLRTRLRFLATPTLFNTESLDNDAAQNIILNEHFEENNITKPPATFIKSDSGCLDNTVTQNIILHEHFEQNNITKPPSTFIKSDSGCLDNAVTQNIILHKHFEQNNITKPPATFIKSESGCLDNAVTQNLILHEHFEENNDISQTPATFNKCKKKTGSYSPAIPCKKIKRSIIETDHGYSLQNSEVLNVEPNKTAAVKSVTPKVQVKNVKYNVTKQQRKCRNLQSQVCKLQKKLAICRQSLKTFSHLKDLNEHLSPRGAIFLDGLFRNVKTKRPTWSLQEKALALDIYKRGPECYAFLESFLTLPSKSTLQKLLKTVAANNKEV